jgi:hypothetical protein
MSIISLHSLIFQCDDDKQLQLLMFEFIIENLDNTEIINTLKNCIQTKHLKNNKISFIYIGTPKYFKIGDIVNHFNKLNNNIVVRYNCIGGLFMSEQDSILLKSGNTLYALAFKET